MWPDGEVDPDVRNNNMGRSSAGSEIVIIDDTAVSTAASTMPNISQLNVTKSSRLHFGPKFVNVTQNVHNTEVVKGRFLGLELISPKNSKRLRCSIAVFVCWAVVVAVCLGLYLLSIALKTEQTRLDLGIKEEWYLRRDDWQAMPPYKLTFLNLPVENVLIGHSATKFCEEKYDCIKEVLDIQRDHLRREWNDIGPNFLVSGNGLIFEGRGANVIGAMVRYWNSRSITIMFLGDYTTDMPRPIQFDHVNLLLSELLKQNVLAGNYEVFGQCQVAPLIIPPGPNIVANLKNITHWNPSNTSGCLG